MDHRQSYDRVVEILRGCARDLLASKGFAATVTEWTSDGARGVESVVAVIGYGGATMRGALLLQCDVNVAQSLVPEGLDLASGGTEALCDVIGEHANRILGRLKNRLHAAGVDFALAIPATAVATNIRLGVPPSAHSASFALTTPRGLLLVRFDAVLAPTFAPGPMDDTPAGDVLGEGEILMF